SFIPIVNNMTLFLLSFTFNKSHKSFINVFNTIKLLWTVPTGSLAYSLVSTKSPAQSVKDVQIIPERVAVIAIGIWCCVSTICIVAVGSIVAIVISIVITSATISILSISIRTISITSIRIRTVVVIIIV